MMQQEPINGMRKVRTGLKRPTGLPCLGNDRADSASGRASSPSANSGHVFILHCEVEGLAADAILVPGGVGSGVVLRGLSQKSSVFEHGPMSNNLGSGELFTTMKSFLDVAGRPLSGTKSVYGRSKPLLAASVPPDVEVGAFIKDIRAISEDEQFAMGPLFEQAGQLGIDVALCVPNWRLYCIMQSYREAMCPHPSGPFWMLSANHKVRPALRHAKPRTTMQHDAK